jgi:hypothetical protein
VESEAGTVPIDAFMSVSSRAATFPGLAADGLYRYAGRVYGPVSATFNVWEQQWRVKFASVTGDCAPTWGAMAWRECLGGCIVAVDVCPLCHANASDHYRNDDDPPACDAAIEYLIDAAERRMDGN